MDGQDEQDKSQKPGQIHEETRNRKARENEERKRVDSPLAAPHQTDRRGPVVELRRGDGFAQVLCRKPERLAVVAFVDVLPLERDGNDAVEAR